MPNILGYVYIGPEAGDIGWQEPLRKFGARSRSLRQMGLGLALTLSTFQVMCLPALQFVLQLYPGPKNVLKQYQETLQLLTAAPRHSFSCNMITRLKSQGLDCEAKELTCLSTASRVRFAASCSAVEQARKDMQEVLHSYERVVAR
eukprot:3379889-Pyramimonas_sp.AAC.1